jgi:hypothetical protein
MSYTLTDIYERYVTDKGPFDRALFKNICTEFNVLIMDHLLEGKEFNLGHNLSTISVVRKERNPNHPRVDWGESNKYKKELIEQNVELYDKDAGVGLKWHIYHTDSFYCKFYWRKGKCSVPNKSVYRFDATRGIKGNKEKLINLLKVDDLAYLMFKKN